ncbi:MAG: hypothetical protein ACRCVN_05090 [Spirochaetia bacterium]
MNLETILDDLRNNLPYELEADDPLSVDNWQRLCRSLSSIEKMLSAMQAPPVGFIYFQLPHQLDPQLLWPMCRWKIIEKDIYDGAFFRTEGGLAKEFETGKQDYAMVEMSGDFSGGCGGFTSGVFEKNPKHNPVWQIGNATVGAGTINAAEQKYFSLKKQWGAEYIDDEIRPKNLTFRLWERMP